MQDNIYVGVEEVMEKMGISKTAAYSKIREWNEVLQKCGCEVKHGKIDRTFFLYKVHGDKTKDCCRIDFVTGYANSDGVILPGTEQTVTVLYNSGVISEAEVRRIIKKHQYEYDSRIITTTPEAADAFCNGIVPGKGA